MEENKSASLVGRYVKVLSTYFKSVDVKVGDYLRIEAKHGERKGQYKLAKYGHFGGDIFEDSSSDNVKLMPEGFDPNDVVDVLPDSAKVSKRLEELEYPDVIHIETQEEYDKLKGIKLQSYKSIDKYYLVGAMDISSNRHAYENQSTIKYVIYEMNQIIFKDEKSWTPIKDMWVVLTEDYILDTGYRKGNIWQLSHPQTFLNSNYWYVMKDGVLGLAPALKGMRPATLQEVTAHLAKEERCKKIEANMPNMTKETLLEEAKRKYPVGTKFRSPQNDKIYTVKAFSTDGPNGNFWHTDKIIVVYVEDFHHGEYLYYQNKWAEIIELPKEQSYEEPWCKQTLNQRPMGWLGSPSQKYSPDIKVWYTQGCDPIQQYPLTPKESYKSKKEVVIIKKVEDDTPSFARVSHHRPIIMKRDE